MKVGVGWNPWGGPRSHDLGRLCAEHGGGGHPVVGGVTLPAGAVTQGRAVVAALAEALGRPATDR